MRNRVHVVIDGSDAVGRRRLRQLTLASDWSLATPLTEPLLVLVHEADSDEGLFDVMPRLQAELKEHGLRPLGMSGQTVHDAPPVVANLVGVGSLEGSLPGIAELFKVAQSATGSGSEPAPGRLSSAAKDGNGAAQRPAPDAQRTATNGAAAGAAPTPAADAGCCSATAIKATADLLADPRPLWEAIGDDGAELAGELIPGVYGDRSAAVRQSGWVTAPDLMLLDAIADTAKRTELATGMLLVRARLTDADRRLRTASAALREQEVELSKARAALADEAVHLAHEVHLQMRKWRSFADVGVNLLIFTTIVAAAAGGYVLSQVERIDDLVAPLIIFALALFAISPAVLLLNQRPLKGLDAWMPGGGAGRGDGAASGSDAGDAAGDAARGAARAR